MRLVFLVLDLVLDLELCKWEFKKLKKREKMKNAIKKTKSEILEVVSRSLKGCLREF